jgi:hypothetical protein
MHWEPVAVAAQVKKLKSEKQKKGSTQNLDSRFWRLAVRKKVSGTWRFALKLSWHLAPRSLPASEEVNYFRQAAGGNGHGNDSPAAGVPTSLLSIWRLLESRAACFPRQAGRCKTMVAQEMQFA